MPPLWWAFLCPDCPYVIEVSSSYRHIGQPVIDELAAMHANNHAQVTT